MRDQRPLEKIQHTFEGYGRFILEYYGAEAYADWLKSIPQNTRPYPEDMLAKALGLDPNKPLHAQR